MIWIEIVGRFEHDVDFEDAPFSLDKLLDKVQISWPDQEGMKRKKLNHDKIKGHEVSQEGFS